MYTLSFLSIEARNVNICLYILSYDVTVNKCYKVNSKLQPCYFEHFELNKNAKQTYTYTIHVDIAYCQTITLENGKLHTYKQKLEARMQTCVLKLQKKKFKRSYKTEKEKVKTT